MSETAYDAMLRVMEILAEAAPAIAESFNFVEADAIADALMACGYPPEDESVRYYREADMAERSAADLPPWQVTHEGTDQ